jgi:hypothetical protein
LLEAKVPPQDPAIQQALTTVRDAGPTLKHAYALGASLFFLNRLNEAETLPASDRDLLRKLALRLAAGQLANGCWHYLNAPITAQAEEEFLQKLRDNTYKPHTAGGKSPGDHSITQFALLSLWGSRRHDLPLRPVLLASVTSFHQTQHPLVLCHS